MRASVASLSKKFISTFFAVTLALGLVPAAAFAVDEPLEDESSQYVIPSDSEESGEALTTSSEEANAEDDVAGSEDAMVIPAATERINEDVVLTTSVAQRESTRSYFLAQTLETTRTIPVVSATLPLDTGTGEETDESAQDGNAAEDEGGEDSDESDPALGVVASASTVVGSFEYLGMTFALEPGGESVVLAAADYAKLPKVFLKNNVIVVPDMVARDGDDYYSVTRIADDAFSALTSEAAHDYVFSGKNDTSEAAFEGVPSIEIIEQPQRSDDELVLDGLPSLAWGIEVIVIPASVSAIGDEAFAGFDTLQYIVVSEDNPTYATYDGALYSADLSQLRLIPEGRSGTVWVAPSATTVDPEVFSHCPSVEAVVADPDGELMVSWEDSLYESDENLFLRIPEGASDVIVREDGSGDEKAVEFASTLAMEILSPLGLVSEGLPINSQVSEEARIALLAAPYDHVNVHANGGSFTNSSYGYAGVGLWFNFGVLSCSGTTVTQTAHAGTFTASNPGCTFLHWSADSNSAASGTQTYNISNCSAAPTDSVYAIWNVPITFSPNGGRWNSKGYSGTSAVEFSERSNIWHIGPNDARPVRDGYTFAGWSEDKNATTATGGSVQFLTKKTFYAVWTRDTYTITLNPNKGTGGTPAVLEKYEDGWYSIGTPSTRYATNTTGISLPTRTGYRFKGYATDRNATDGTYWKTYMAWPSNKQFKEDTTLFAIWEQNPVYEIILNPNGGSGGTSTVYEWYGKGWYSTSNPTDSSKALTSITLPTREGYTFTGYGPNQDDQVGMYWTTNSSFLSNTQFPGARILYAIWVQNPVYEITLDAKGGTGGTSKIYEWYDKGWYATSAPDESSTPLEWDNFALPEYRGHTFEGYFVQWGSLAGIPYFKDSLPDCNTFSGSQTLNAHWDPNRYKVEYYNRAGTELLSTDPNFVYGTARRLAEKPNTGFTEGYEPLGWANDPNQSVAAYSWGVPAINLTDVADGTAKLFLAESPNEYTVTWNYNGAKDKSTETVNNVAFGSPISMKDPGDNPGHNFAGWEATGSVTGTYAKGGSCTMGAGNVTFTAQWTRGSSIKVSLVDERFSTTKNPVWYWPGKGYLTGENSTTVIAKKGKIVADPQPNKDPHFKFLGYFDTKNGTINDNEHKMINADGTLNTDREITEATSWYAHWEEVSCKVDLLAAYGEPLFKVVSSGTKTIDRAYYGKAFDTSVTNGKIEAPSRKGYTFMGYYTLPNADMLPSVEASDYAGVRWIEPDGTLSKNDWTVHPASDDKPVNLYAAWRHDGYAIDFDLKPVDEGAESVQECALTPLTWHYGEDLTKVAFPTPNRDGGFYRNGYAFTGWAYYNDADELVKVYDAKTAQGVGSYDREKGAVLHALWEPITYTVVFDWNHEGAGRYTYEVPYDSSVSFTQGELEKEAYLDYELIGWKTADDRELVFDADGRAHFNPSSAHALPRETVYYAQWKAPDDSLITLYADDHCSLTRGDEGEPPYKVYSFYQQYGHEVALRDSKLGLDPDPDTGYDFVCWQRIATGTDGLPLKKDGEWVIAEASVSTIGERNTKNVYLVAHTAAHRCSITLQPGVDENGEAVPRAEVTFPGWNHEGDVYEFDISDHTGSDGSFSSITVPDAVRAGYTFEGWKLRGSDGDAMAGLVIDSAEISESASRHRVYDAVWAPKTYEVVFTPNRDDLTEEQTAAETIVREAVMGSSIETPYPATRGSGLVFTGWTNVAIVDPGQSPVFYEPREEVSIAELLRTVGEQKDANRIVLYAQWSPTISVTAPLWATVVIDPDNGDMIASDNMALTSRYSSSSNVPPLEIMSVRYDKLRRGQTSIFDAPLTSAGVFDKGKVYLTVYAGLEGKPDLSKEATGTPEPSLKIDLANSVTVPKDASDSSILTLAGAKGLDKRFASDGDALSLYYGLEFADGVDMRSFVDALPKKDVAGPNGWSSESYPIARIYYTVGLAD